MRFVILCAASLLVLTGPYQSAPDAELALLRSIPEADLTDSETSEAEEQSRLIIERRTVDMAVTALDQGQCLVVCISAARSLEEICQRQIRSEAPMSRAICFSRVDADRLDCERSCEE